MSCTELHTTIDRFGPATLGRRAPTRFALLPVAAILLVLSIPSLPVDAQPPGEEEPYPWEEWTLDSLETEDFDEIDDGINEVVHYSKGILPTPSPGASFELVFPLFYNNVFDRAEGVRSAFAARTAEPFGDDDPYNCPFRLFGDCEERTILERGGSREADGGYPEREFAEFGLRLSYHLPLPAVLQVALAYRHAGGILYSEDTSRAYLSYDGSIRSFREIGQLHYETWGVSGSVGLHIPVYGAFLTTKALTFGSYYYLGGGLSADYALDSRVNQFTQIADAKDQIRYGNLQDTAVLFRRHQPDGFARLRTGIELHLGWRVTAEVISFGFEAFASLPRESLLEDAEWKEYYGGFRMFVGYLWGTGVLWR